MEQEHLPDKRIVAFADILGFRSLVNRMTQEPHIYNLIKDSLKQIVDEQERYRIAITEHKKRGLTDTHLVPFLDIEQSQFSDSIVLSLPIYEDEPGRSASTIIHFISRLAGKLIQEGIFIRAGIAVGWTYHKDSVLLGKGMIDAYDIESKVARVPRIVVVDEIVSILPRFDIEHRLRRDTDGVWFVNVFEELWYGDQIAIPDADKFKIVGEHIRSGLEQVRGKKPDLVAKYRWLAFQFNQSVEENKKWPNWSGVEKLTLD